MDKEQIKWFIQVFIMTFILSMLFSYISANGVSNLSLIPAILILILVIGIGIFFDIIGVAVTVANEHEFHAKASKKIEGSKASIKLIRNAPKVANILLIFALCRAYAICTPKNPKLMFQSAQKLKSGFVFICIFF